MCVAGQAWWVLMLVLRLLVLLLAGFTLFSDEQERFNCNTAQPGCSNVCFDLHTPVSVLRLWLFHLTLLCLPHLMFAAYIMHRVLSRPYFGSSCWDGDRGSSPCSLGNSGSSREPSLHKASLHNLPLEWRVPRFYGAYFLVITLRILLETVFSAAQFLLFGLSFSRSFLCFEAPCTSGVECYISRATEKNLMLNFMLCLASLSVLLSLADLVSSVKAMVRWRRKREVLMEEISKGEQSSTFTVITEAEDSDILLSRRISPSGSSKVNSFRDDGVGLLHTKVPLKPGGTANDKRPENTDGKEAMPSASSQFVPHRHFKPALSPKADGGSLSSPRAAAHILHLPHHRLANAGQQSGSSGFRDKRAWV